MAIARTPRWSLRLEQADFSRLVWAFVFSVAFHAMVYGSYSLEHKYHLAQYLHLPSWLRLPPALTELIKPKLKLPPPRSQEVPLMFVNVSPAQATAEPPKDAKYYSDKNSVAANPQADKITETPKIDGAQTHVPKTEDVPREKFAPLQPSRPGSEAPGGPGGIEAQTCLHPRRPHNGQAGPHAPTGRRRRQRSQARPPAHRPGSPRPPAGQPPARTEDAQDGGVQRRREFASLDTKATPFGAYDAALVDAVSQRWWSLLDERDYASDSRGKVVLQFRLHYDGRITDMSVSENSAGDVLGLICQKAVLDPAPFAAWPSDMRRILGDTRNIQFTFYYN